MRRLPAGAGVLAALTAFLGPGAVCDGQQPKAVLKGVSGKIWSVAFSPDGKTLAAACDNGVEFWETLAGGRRATFGKQDGAHVLAFSPDGKTLALGRGGGKIKLRDGLTGRVRRRLRGHPGAVFCLAFHPAGRLLASGGEAGTVRLWDVTTGAETATLPGYMDEVYRHVHAVAFSPDGRLLAAGGGGAVRLWDVGPAPGKAPRLRRLLRYPEGVQAVAFSPDGKLLASGGGDGTVRLSEAASPKELYKFRWSSTLRTAGYNASLAFSPDGKLLAACALSWKDFSAEVYLWDLAAREQRGTLGGHADSIWSIAFSPDGRLLASGSYDGTVRLCDVRAALKAGK
jgi:WD40 repeat protein